MRGIVGLLFYSVVALAPILGGAFIASRLLLRRDRLTGLAPLAVVIGFLAGGVVGWAFVPAQWTASFWTTVEAAGNASRYGESFEHMAEHALLYCFYSALVGAVASGVAALVFVWRVPVLGLRDSFRRIKPHVAPRGPA